MAYMITSTMKEQDGTENWDDDFEETSPHTLGPSTPSSKGVKHHWVEPGPSTPLKRLQQTENWDDDFRDTDSPRPSTTRKQNGASGRAAGSPVENWDDDFEDARTGTSPRRRTPRKKTSWGSSDEEDDGGFADRDEDRTVTSRSRGMPLQLITEVPPVPPLPSPFPRSPTASVFSVPVSSTGRDSVAGYSYSSTAHLALRPTVSNSSAVAARLALLPPSPPIHRERRRLRKKSRPPGNFEEGIFELDDRAELAAEQARPSTPENPREPPLIAPLYDPPSDVANTSLNKTPLLSRIGSVGKKWGAARKKRASTGPSEVTLQERDEPPLRRERPRPQDSDSSRPTSFIASSSPGHGGARGWFFRSGGGGQGPGLPSEREGALKHEKSVERLLHLMGVDREREPGSPASIGRKGRIRLAKPDPSALPSDLEQALSANVTPSSPVMVGPSRRPLSMQISAADSSSGSSWNSRPPVPRHVSYGEGRYRPTTPTSSSRASSKHRFAAASVEDVNRAKKDATAAREGLDDRSSDAHESPFKVPSEEDKGNRRLMNGIRRLSLVGGKHKRAKSITVDEKEKRERRPTTASSAHASTYTRESELAHDQTTPRPPSRIARSQHDMPLLPPIELQPPSPPATKRECKPMLSVTITTPTQTRQNSLEETLDASHSHPTLSSRSSTSQETPVPTITPPSTSPTPTPKHLTISPAQTASLGRTAQPPKDRDTHNSSSVPRRNSLGDLKIPARISQAQMGLRRDLSMVREFATSVEQLKLLQMTYTMLVGRVRTQINEPHESQSRPVTPTFMPLLKPPSRSRANTSPTAKTAPHRSQLHTSFLNIEAKYRLSWECAELLVDLAGGSTAQSASPPASSQSAPAVPSTSIPDGRKSRERAITLSGEVSPALSPITPPFVSPSPSQWRASTGRHDLSQRQLHLLREMLNNSDPSVTMTMEPNIPEEEVNRNWRWGDAMNSTVTLPSEDSGPAYGPPLMSPTKRPSKPPRRGMRYIRDMLRNLTKNPNQVAVPPSSSSVGASTDSSLNVPRPESVASRRDYRHPNSPYNTTPSLPHKPSPRRPSLASIFRLGQKAKVLTSSPSADDLSSNRAGVPSSLSREESGTSLDDDEDWDRIESASDLDHVARSFGLSSDGTATVRGKRGKSPYLFQQRPDDADTTRVAPAASHSSIFAPVDSPITLSAIPPSMMQSYSRSIKLSDVREHVPSEEQESGQPPRAPSRNRKRQSAPTGSGHLSVSPRRPASRTRKNPTGSVRSAPRPPRIHQSPDSSGGPVVDVKLAMAPENIKPLLENAREVHTRCSECITELETLLSNVDSSSVGVTAA